MKTLFTIVALGVVMCGLCFTSVSAQEGKPDGMWAGGISFGGWYPIRVQFKTGVQGLEGTVYPNGYNLPGQPVLRSRLAGSNLHFEWEERDGLAVFDGTLQYDAITGEFEQNKRRGIFRLARVADVNLQTFSQYHGLYQLKAGHFVWIGRASELRRQPSFIDTSTGRFGILYPSSDNAFFSGGSAFIPSPADIRIRFVKNEKEEVVGLIWQQGGAEPESAPRSRLYEEEEVKFNNQNVTLAGTLIKPVTKGPHPAVVLIHGSGGSTRWYFSSLPYLLAARGIASLIYDKRGSGESTGSRHTSIFTDLADDAIAAVNLLKNRQDINARQIGVWGHSQGGWTGPLAASRSKDVAFVITAAGPAVSIDQQSLDLIEFNVRAGGFSEAEVHEALAHESLFYAVRDGREKWETLRASIQNVQAKPWGRFLTKPKSESEVVSDQSEVYDPTVVLQHLKVPMLALFGGFDEKVPPAKNARKMEQYMEQAGIKDFTVKIFAKADHDFWEAEAMGNKGFINRKRYVSGYFDTIIQWVLNRVDVPK